MTWSAIAREKKYGLKLKEEDPAKKILAWVWPFGCHVVIWYGHEMLLGSLPFFGIVTVSTEHYSFVTGTVRCTLTRQHSVFLVKRKKNSDGNFCVSFMKRIYTSEQRQLEGEEDRCTSWHFWEQHLDLCTLRKKDLKVSKPEIRRIPAGLNVILRGLWLFYDPNEEAQCGIKVYIAEVNTQLEPVFILWQCLHHNFLEPQKIFLDLDDPWDEKVSLLIDSRCT